MSFEEQENDVDLNTVRITLKSWEQSFKATNGRKPGRADIKANATIQAQYRLYERLAGRVTDLPPPPPSAETPKKSTRTKNATEPLRERPQNVISSTPRKTPSKTKHASLAPPVLSPVQGAEPTPAFIRRALGPTPQRDGHVLGIFDIFSGGTPAGKDTGTTGQDIVIAGTPSKGAHHSSPAKFSKSPQSSGKRRYLDAFAGTPLKAKRDDNVGTTSSSRRKFATPAFLRRSFPLASINEEGSEAPAPVPAFKKRGLFRSLSSMIQNMRKQEEQSMDDEWDIMNELEQEEQGVSKKQKTGVLVEDSQVPDMPLGPDAGPESSDEASAGEETGAVRKPWKKKGLKRQTRRTNMRPVLHKAKKAGELDDESEAEVVAETQVVDGTAGIGSEDEEEEDGDQDKAATKKKKKRKSDAKARKSTAKDDKDKEKPAKKPRKVDPNAHANFRALKIKNKNSKAGGRGRKFGRR